MQVLTTLDTASACPKDTSKTTLSLTTGSSSTITTTSTNNNNNNASSSISCAIALSQLNNSGPARNVLSFYTIGGNDAGNDNQPLISYRSQVELSSSSSSSSSFSCVTATTANHPGDAGDAEMWVACGGKTTQNNATSAAIWYGPVLGGSVASLASAQTIVTLPSSSSPVSHLSFLSSSTLALATSDGKMGMFDVATSQLTSAIAPVPSISGGMRPTSLIPAEDPNSFFLVTGRLVARIDTRINNNNNKMHSHSVRPAQCWMWHPHDRLSAISFDSFTSSTELICGSEEGTVMLFDSRASSSSSINSQATGSSSSSSTSASSSPWQVNPRPGTSISGLGRVAGGAGICISWNDCLIGSVDVVSSPTSETKSTMRVINNNNNSRSAPTSTDNNNNNNNQLQTATLSSPAHEFVHDSAVCGSNSGSVVLAQDRNVGIVGSRRGKLSVVGYR